MTKIEDEEEHPIPFLIYDSNTKSNSNTYHNFIF